MARSKQNYLAYWKQLKLFVDEQGQNWTFYSLEEESQAVVKIGSPRYKICLSLIGLDSRSTKNSIAAGFWIPDSRESFDVLRARSGELETAMGKALVWDSRAGRKSCWIWITAAIDLSHEKNWPASFEWFAKNAERIRDVCHDHLL